METEIATIENALDRALNNNPSGVTTANCPKCGDATPQDPEGFKKYGACVCVKCSHAYACFDLMYCSRRAAYQKREADVKTADYNYGLCRQSFQSKYGMDWRTWLAKIMPQFDLKLRESLSGRVDISGAVIYYKSMGFI